MKITTTFEPNAETMAKIEKKLLDYNRPFFAGVDKKDFAITLEDSGAWIGGATGFVFGEWLEIDYLVVDEKYRRHGYGKQLLTQIENIAVEQNCRHLLLFTFDFQAVNYYPKFGFKEVFQLANYPTTGSQHWFIKEL